MMMPDKTKARVLIVDDEKLILSSLSRILKRNHEVFVASCYEEAEKLLRQKPVDVVVSDCAMPGRDGVEVLKMASRIQPGAMRIMHSGNPPNDYHLMQRAGLFKLLLNKPAHQELMEVLDEVVKSSPA